MVTNVETSELIKYASNAFLATKITFINEVAALCERLGADVIQVARGMGLDQRIGPQFLHPGPGYGGSCFPKDTEALVEIARRRHALRIVEAVGRSTSAAARRRQVVDALDGGRAAARSVALPLLSPSPTTSGVAGDDGGSRPARPRRPWCTSRPGVDGPSRRVLPDGVTYCATLRHRNVADVLVLSTE